MTQTTNPSSEIFLFNHPDRPRHQVGQLVSHKQSGYRGVVVDVHRNFQGTDEWYEREAKSRPPKDEPWYEVLVHDSIRTTYVAEQHLDLDISGLPVEHPMLRMYFNEFHQGRYRVGGMTN